MKTWQDNDETNHTSPLHVETKLNYYDWSNGVWFMMKTRQDNDKIDRIGTIYAKIGTKMSWSIKQDTVYDEKQTKQRYDQSYKCNLRKIRYLTIKTQWTVCDLWRKWDKTTMWLILQVCLTPKTKLDYYCWSDEVWSMTKMKQDNNVTNHNGAFYTKIGIEVS